MAAPQLYSPTASAFSAMSGTLEDLIAQRKAAAMIAQMQAQKAAQQGIENDINERKTRVLERPDPTKAPTPVKLVPVYNSDGSQTMRPETEGLNLGRKPESAPASEPLETVIDPKTGKPILNPRSKSAGMAPYEKPAAPTHARYQVQTMSDPTTGKDVLVRLNLDTGQVEPMDAGGLQPRQAPKPPTGTERQTRDYYARMRQALDDMASVEDKLTDFEVGTIQSSPLPDAMNNLMIGPNGKKYAQALRAFTLAKLRKESGAAISAGEFAKEGLTAARNLNDTPEVMAQKRNAREMVAEGFAASSGKAYDEFYGKPYERRQQGAQQSGAGGGKSVTMAELQAIAKRKGTSVEQEQQRAAAAGYVVR